METLDRIEALQVKLRDMLMRRRRLPDRSDARCAPPKGRWPLLTA